MGELKANVFAAPSRANCPGRASGEWRVFGLGYSEYRDGVVKTDNRPLTLRTADADRINIATYGGQGPGDDSHNAPARRQSKRMAAGHLASRPSMGARRLRLRIGR